MARRRHGKEVALARLDGCFLPFQTGSFDVVLLFEVIYYFASPDRVLEECHRVLTASGHLLTKLRVKLTSKSNVRG